MEGTCLGPRQVLPEDTEMVLILRRRHLLAKNFTPERYSTPGEFWGACFLQARPFCSISRGPRAIEAAVADPSTA